MPLRERNTFLVLLASIVSGGFAPFQSAPRTYGRLTSPASKATKTSSFTSGMNHVPRLSPAIKVARRAHASTPLSSGPLRCANRTFTRPRLSGSALSITTAGQTPLNWFMHPSTSIQSCSSLHDPHSAEGSFAGPDLSTVERLHGARVHRIAPGKTSNFVG